MSADFEINLNIKGVKNVVKEARIRAMRDAVEFLLTEANKHVPHDDGTLERSGRADVNEDGTRGSVSYDTPYAPRQHEDMALRHPGKGQAKWLENTMTRDADTVLEIIGNTMRQAVGDD